MITKFPKKQKASRKLSAVCALLALLILAGCASGSSEKAAGPTSGQGNADSATYLVRLYKNEDVSEESFLKDAEIIRNRVEVLTGSKGSFSVKSREEDAAVPLSYIDAQIPAQVFGGLDPEILIPTLLSGPEKFYLFDASKGLTGEASSSETAAGPLLLAPEDLETGETSSSEAAAGPLLLAPEDLETAEVSRELPPGLSQFQLALEGISEENYSAVKFVLTEEFLEAHPGIRTWTPALALDSSGDLSDPYVFSLVPGENERTFYYRYNCANTTAGAGADSLDRCHEVLARNMTNAPSESVFGHVWIPPVTWETPDTAAASPEAPTGTAPASPKSSADTDAASPEAPTGTDGSFQLSQSGLSELSKDSGTLTFFYTWRDEDPDPEDMDAVREILKSRLDAVGMPYALGRQSDRGNVFVVCTLPGRISPQIADLLCANSVITLVSGAAEKFVTPGSCRAKVIPASGHYALSLDFSAHNLDLPSLLISSGKAAGSDTVALRVSYSQSDFCTGRIGAAGPNGKLLFDRRAAGAGFGDPDKWVLDLIAAALNGPPLQPGIGQEKGQPSGSAGSIGYDRKIYQNYLTWDRLVLRQKGEHDCSRSYYYSSDPDAAGY